MNVHSPYVAAAPFVSVVIPVHNGARWLGETLVSLYTQSLLNFEVILVDDASTDALRAVLDVHTDERLRVFHLPNNVGVSAARNHGIDQARGKYIAFCDADDLCNPLRLERQWFFLESEPDIGMCGSAFTCFDTQDRDIVIHPQSDIHIRKAMMHGNCFGLSTVMVKASLLKTYRFDVSLKVSEDYELWSRMIAAGVHVANMPTSLVRYRLHQQQASRYKAAELDQISRRVRALYCARLLGDEDFLQRIVAFPSHRFNLDQAAQRVMERVRRDSEFVARDFRFLLAWLYQQQPDHNIGAWWRWTQIQASLGLNLDRTYRLNTALLAFAPEAISRRYFDLLLKLKY
ncbi:glycosyltransferase family 2 protein [Curvibacter sp. APW13]|uniref:glycosyltransferase family 2 protein n=1 Tax=Curvibacter sp. APW13 TaxID=3077236 RepID=UPI0028DED7B0|nr:glycosyltransferase family 2 protein [Curvibacter sp. APW13]MDT8991563.1 glycosyltransferase family 2 protein [Curvibacter sp. APW13]